MQNLNELPLYILRDLFKCESYYRYTSDELGLTVEFANDDKCLVEYKGRVLKPYRHNQYVVEGGVVDMELLLAVLLNPNIPDTERLSQLEIVSINHNHAVKLKGEYIVRSVLVDVYDTESDSTLYHLTKGEVMKRYDLSASMVYDLIDPQYSERIGYQGLFMRSSPLGEDTEFKVVDTKNAYYADTAGIFIAVHYKELDNVVVCNGMQEVVDLINRSQEPLVEVTVESLQKYFRRNNMAQGYLGWRIRRIDDIHGLNIRFSYVESFGEYFGEYDYPDEQD